MLKNNRIIALLFMMAVNGFLFLACGGGGGGGGSDPSNPPAGAAPAITAQPKSVTVNTGQKASFNVTATGEAPLNYQWRRNDTAINGATSASYTTLATTMADNEAKFTVVVTNAVQSATSNPAILTVDTGNLASQISQYGITWTFDKAYPIGQFVTGDYWVVGPVSIVDITPKSIARPEDGRVINGSMLNPAISFNQGYDSRMMGDSRGWVPALNVGRPDGNDLSAANPLIINSPASLVSGISYPITGAMKNVRVMAILTVLANLPPADAFRPPYVGTDKNIRHTLSEIQASLLPRLAVPSGAGMTVSEVAAHFEKPWVEHMQDWQKEIFCAPDNMPAYGREIASAVSDGALMLMLDVDPEQKALLLKRFIQLGLDDYGLLQVPNGRTTWRADGGHMPGRAFPILFAGHLLGDQAMLGVMQESGQYAYQNGYFEGRLPPNYIHFGEIDQTFFVTQRDVDRTHSAAWNPDSRSPRLPYETSDIGMADWGICHVHSPLGDNKEWTAIYRAVNTPAWSGFILASRLLGITNQWNHPPLFAYMDRWVARGEEAGLNDFQKRMWANYR